MPLCKNVSIQGVNWSRPQCLQIALSLSTGVDGSRLKVKVNWSTLQRRWYVITHVYKFCNIIKTADMIICWYRWKNFNLYIIFHAIVILLLFYRFTFSVWYLLFLKKKVTLHCFIMWNYLVFMFMVYVVLNLNLCFVSN